MAESKLRALSRAAHAKKTAEKPFFTPVRLSLADIVGADYIRSVLAAASALRGREAAAHERATRKKKDFFPAGMQQRLAALLPSVGRRLSKPFPFSAHGAATDAFCRHSTTEGAPLSAYGYYRVGEDGRLRIATKSEHYHAPLGHFFPGYELLGLARTLGIPNATHNNTRGHITRLLEEELLRTANYCEDAATLSAASRRAGILNRVLNLETGSIAVEAGLKLALARFYRVQADAPAAEHAGKTPTIIVVGDHNGNPTGNYHGTSIVAQLLRGMWAQMRARMEKAGILKVIAVRPNDINGLEAAFRAASQRNMRPAVFCHEIVMMNYGGIRLSPEFLRKAYALCRRHGAPTLADEIQSCLWNPHLYMFKEYGLRPDMVAVGKGMPGGEYAASRLIFNARLDCLPQFGALVTNGQQELAALAYLITMRWAEANAEATRRAGDYFEGRLRELGDAFPSLIAEVEGSRHMSSLIFDSLKAAVAFVSRLTEKGVDISVQTYKKDVSPAALLKMPLITDMRTADFVVNLMRQELSKM